MLFDNNVLQDFKTEEIWFNLQTPELKRSTFGIKKLSQEGKFLFLKVESYTVEKYTDRSEEVFSLSADGICFSNFLLLRLAGWLILAAVSLLHI